MNNSIALGVECLNNFELFVVEFLWASCMTHPAYMLDMHGVVLAESRYIQTEYSAHAIRSWKKNNEHIIIMLKFQKK